MTKEQILNRIALEKHGIHFNEITDIKERAEILQQALDETIALSNNDSNNICLNEECWIKDHASTKCCAPSKLNKCSKRQK